MPRRSSGGRSARPAPRPAARSPPPQKVNHAPPPAVQSSSGGSMLGGIGSTIAQGMAFGTGSAVAHRAVDSVMGPRTIQHETVGSEAAAAPASAAPSMGGSDACGMHFKAFQDVSATILLISFFLLLCWIFRLELLIDVVTYNWGIFWRKKTSLDVTVHA
ncbi:hypothetical protein ACS0TY_002868 [Phlomoides rotata]